MASVSTSTIEEFIRYNNWANREVFRVCETLTAEQLAATTPGSYGTIRDTLEHIISGEAFYVRLLTGTSPLPSFRGKDKPDMETLSGFLSQVGQALIETVRSVNPETIVVDEEDGKILKYKALALLIQIINHGVEHRTNITTILAQQGVAPPEVDGWGYMWSHRDLFGVVEEGSVV